MVGIYKITNPKGRIYIGQSTDIEARWRGYRKPSCKTQIKLYSSFKKYGVSKHSFEVLEECKVEKLNERERYYQEKYNVLTQGLNCKLTETNDRSGRMSEESRARMSNSHKGVKRGPHSEEHKAKLSRAHKGKKQGPLSEEHKAKMSVALKKGAMITCPICGKEKYQSLYAIKKRNGIIHCSKKCVNISRTRAWRESQRLD